MSVLTNSSKATLHVLGAILVLDATLFWFSSEEQTLGTGIKSVYVHVALTWTGMAGAG